MWYLNFHSIELIHNWISSLSIRFYLVATTNSAQLKLELKPSFLLLATLSLKSNVPSKSYQRRRLAVNGKIMSLSPVLRYNMSFLRLILSLVFRVCNGNWNYKAKINVVWKEWWHTNDTSALNKQCFIQCDSKLLHNRF